MKKLILFVSVLLYSFAIDVNLNSNVTAIEQNITSKILPLNGYYSHYGDGAFDWIYIVNKTKKVYKLDGFTEDGYLIWKEINITNKDIIITDKNVVILDKNTSCLKLKE